MENSTTSSFFVGSASVFRTIMLSCALLIFTITNSSATTYFISSAGGNWNAGAAWSTASCGGANCLCSPASSSDIVMLSCAKTITVTATVTQTGAITISGGTLIINSGVTLNCTSLTMTSGTLTVNGTLTVGLGGTGALSITGGTFTAPTSATGTVILSSTAQTITGAGTLSFYNLTVANSGAKTMATNTSVLVYHTLTQTGTATLAVGANTLSVGTGLNGNGITDAQAFITTTSSSNLSFGGGSYNYTLGNILTSASFTSGTCTLTSFTMTSDLATITLGTSQSLTVSGAFNLSSGGNFHIGANTLTLNGAVTMSGTCFCNSITGGSTSNITIGGSGAASLYFDLTTTTAGGTNTIATFTNTRTSNSIVLLDNLRIGTSLTQASASSSVTIDGSSISSTLTIDGALSGSGGFVGNSSLSTLTINGSGALGGNITFVTTQSLSGLIMNRSSGTATLNSPLATGSLQLTNGVLTTTATNLLTVTGGTSGSVSNTGGSSSYISGPLAENVTPSTSSATYIFPVGKSAYQKLAFNNITTSATAGNVVIRAEAFDGSNSGTFDGTISALRTDNYWATSVTANAGNLTAAGTVSLTDASPTIVTGSVVGYSTVSAGSGGPYTSLGGSISAPVITSTTSVPVGLGFFDIGTGGCSTPATPTVSVTNNCGNSVLSTAATGTLSWSSGATTTAITVTASGTYSVTTTVSGCTSAAGTNTAAPKAIPSAPTVSVADNCGNSVLSTTATGALSWTGGATTTAITVTAAGTYSVTTTVSTCTSPAGTNTAAPLTVPSAPTISVANNCGSSTLSSSATGALSWSTGATTSAITVTNATTYSLTTNNGSCSSAAGTGTAAPTSIPSAPSGTSSQWFCKGSTVSNIKISGTAILWYDALSGGSLVSPSATLVSGSDYFASQTVNGCESTDRLDVTATVSSCISLTVKFFLQGYYLESGTMSPLLKLLNISSNATDVDTVTVELHTAGSPTTAAYSYTGILQNDGNIVCSFDTASAGIDHYIVVKHRNSLTTYSAGTLTIADGGSYDFTTGAGQAYGSGNTMANVGGVYAIYGGDINQDGAIDATDKAALQSVLYTFPVGVYDVNDVTGDGFVDEDDLRVLQNNVPLGITVQHP